MHLHRPEYMPRMTRDPGTLSSEAAVDAWAQMLRVSQALLDAVEGDLKAAGLPPLVWYDALLELRRAGPEGLRPVALQGQMLLAQYNLSRLLARLELEGVVVRRPSSEDGRGQVVSITDSGRDLIQRMWPVYRDAIARHFSRRLDADDLTQLSAILGKLTHVADR
jgi:DNA-binding MarR family transcriptional regulator